MRHESIWRKTRESSSTGSRAAALPKEVDVLVVGGGITGLTTAYLLARAGKRVAVVERERIGAGETGNTSAHLTALPDLGFTTMTERFGRDATTLVWEGQMLAIDLIESIVERERIDCGFVRVPGWICAPFLGEAPDERGMLDDAELAAELGIHAQYHQHGPVGGRPAVSFPDQALFHPLRYLDGLARALRAMGATIHEHAEVSEVLQDPLVAVVNAQNVACGDIVVATHVPIMGSAGMVSAIALQAKLYPTSSYVAGGRIAEPIASGLYEDTASPYRYLRVHEDAGGRYAILGGFDHKTGVVTDTDARFAELVQAFRAICPSVDIDARWTGQVIETSDGLPFVGETAPHQWAATGYAGNGLTFGTLAALVLHDAITGTENPWRTLLDPDRKALDASVLATVAAQNLKYPFYYVADRLRRDRSHTVRDLQPGEGRVLTIGGKPVACSRSASGEVLKVSAVCTHMGCLVRWNHGDRTWDCPCHGSRFTPDGLVIGGPAEAALEKVE